MRIAVIGSGIAGNSAAWALSGRHEVVLYEKRARAGGHSATVDIDHGGAQLSVDTGFIVYNELNYPNLTALFDHLGVRTQASNMSFSFSLDRGVLEWSGVSLDTIFGQRRNVASPRFLWMLREILRFNKQAVADRGAGGLGNLTLRDYLDRRGFSRSFASDYLLPMGSAIWSSPPADILSFPAENFVAFFENHRLVNTDRPVWRTVSGGSRSYVERLISPLKDRMRLATPVRQIRRSGGKVHVTDTRGHEDVFDHVILAAHTDQSLAMLADASPAEREILGAIRYRPNRVYLHSDPELMPKRRKVWASWNYLASSDPGAAYRDASVSYWMNRLQHLPQDKPVFVTLNPLVPPREALTFGSYTFDHPQFDKEAIAAQGALHRIQGTRNTWFCGAWCGLGFHEDGLKAGLSVADALGGEIPWRITEEGIARTAEAAE
ncbi:NAD(P)/FAD-dependent oxidoreductase [Stappia indica]|uniref:NAD(P)/FAD-dependent oxidoreductase n=1 Tax=Stappia indica TaxID=538381 RepID=UPI001CD47A00|nr:FAD-dependent oxidoreductase [Stappia indica]MCA1297451.1 FAD-dependent oxidoreductase [Stappia indica]